MTRPIYPRARHVNGMSEQTCILVNISFHTLHRRIICLHHFLLNSGCRLQKETRLVSSTNRFDKTNKTFKFYTGMKISHLSSRFAVLKPKLVTYVIFVDSMRLLASWKDMRHVRGEVSVLPEQSVH